MHNARQLNTSTVSALIGTRIPEEIVVNDNHKAIRTPTVPYAGCTTEMLKHGLLTGDVECAVLMREIEGVKTNISGSALQIYPLGLPAFPRRTNVPSTRTRGAAAWPGGGPAAARDGGGGAGPSSALPAVTRGASSSRRSW